MRRQLGPRGTGRRAQTRPGSRQRQTNGREHGIVGSKNGGTLEFQDSAADNERRIPPVQKGDFEGVRRKANAQTHRQAWTTERTALSSEKGVDVCNGSQDAGEGSCNEN